MVDLPCLVPGIHHSSALSSTSPVTTGDAGRCTRCRVPPLAHRIELDGRLGHEWTSERWDDLDRDIDSAVDGHLTVRIGWRQVLEPCRLAQRIARLLAAQGWAGTARSCGPGCIVA
jgi:hypothetical protein